jgi:nicotinate-nucleotide adenylyltransferase
MRNKKVGILGGSFDPPTLAHEAVGKVFLEGLKLDEVRYVPARQNPLKVMKAWARPIERWNMIQMLVEGNEGYSASNLEIVPELIYTVGDKYIEDTEDERPSYTYHTLQAFQMLEPHTEFVFLGGSDILRSFYKWYKAEEIIKNFHLGIAIRPPHSLASTISPILEEHRKYVTILEHHNMPDISSTDVRSFLENGHIELAKQLLKPSIFEYVMDNGLYKIPQTEGVLNT